MQIIILGNNSVSIAIAKALFKENHCITLLSTDNIPELEHNLNIKIINGIPSHPQSLHKANAESAEIIIAATLNDEMNMTACQVAHTLFKTPKKIAIIHDNHYFANPKLFADNDMPIDITLNPDQLIANHIFQLLESTQPSAFQYNCNIEAIALKIEQLPNKNYPTYLELSNHYNVAIPIIKNINHLNKEITAPVQINETALIIGENQNLRSLITEISSPAKKHKKIIIASGNNKALALATACCNNYKVTIIEPDKNICQKIAEKLPKANIINSAASNDALLLQENIEATDCFISMSEDDEDNILMSLQAKHLGAKKVITIVQKNNYLSVLDKNKIDKIISPQNILKQNIIPYTRDESLNNTIFLNWHNTEIINVEKNNLPKQYEKFICGVTLNDKFIVGNNNNQYDNALLIMP